MCIFAPYIGSLCNLVSRTLASSKSNDQLNDHVNNNEPIYSEPFPPENDHNGLNKSACMLNKFYPDPSDPVQISHHIYEYLVQSKRQAESAAAKTQENLINIANIKRRGSLSSSPSDGSSTNNSKQPDFSSGKQNPC